MNKELNKELIKKLEGVGFKSCEHSGRSKLNIKGVAEIYYWHNIDRIGIYFVDHRSGKQFNNLTFPQILGRIKEHTGVDLQPKKTGKGLRKPLELFALNMEERLRDNDHKKGWSNCSDYFLIDKIRKNTNRVSDTLLPDKPSLRSKALDDIIDIANYAMMLYVNNLPTRTFEVQGQTKKQRIEQLESQVEAMRANQELLEDALKEINGRVDEIANKEEDSKVKAACEVVKSVGQALSGAPKQPAFKIGDEVVFKKNKTIESNELKLAQEKSTVCVVEFLGKDDTVRIVVGHTRWVVGSEYLEYAPKQEVKEEPLKFGDWAVTLVDKESFSSGIPKGTKVIITRTADSDGDVIAHSTEDWEYYKPSELKRI